MEQLDYRVGFNIDSSTVASLQSLLNELERIQEAVSKINSTGVRFGASGGGGGGSYGGGGGGGGYSRNAAQSASGMGGAFSNQPDMGGDWMDQFRFPQAPAPVGADDDGVNGRGRDRNGSWQNWARISGFNAVAYGLEDMYYAGFRGAMNNVPFVLQGLSSSFMKPENAMAMAGVGALAATGGAMLYDNRETIFGEAALGSREDSIFGVATRSEAGRYDKLANDAMFYADRYGSGSRLGRSYMAEAGSNIARAQDAALMDLSPERMAAILRTPTAAQIGMAERLGALDAPFGGVVQDRISDLYGNQYNDYLKRAQEDAEKRAGFFSGVSAADITKQAKALMEQDVAGTSSLIMSALQGDPSAIRSLEENAKKENLTQQQRDLMRGAISLGRNLSTADTDRISQLRAGANNPYADLDYRSRELRGLLDRNGASPEMAGMLNDAINDDMKERQRNASMPWQDLVKGMNDRWVGNIAATFGSIELNSPYGKTRNAQASNLRSEIYNTLIANGVPAAEAAKRAGDLYQQGYEQYQTLSQTANNMQNGMPVGLNFMSMLNDEQNVAFQQYQQNQMQIMMTQSAYRRMQMVRSRNNLRGGR